MGLFTGQMQWEKISDYITDKSDAKRNFWNGEYF